jgi:hypothetical protein
MYLTAVYIAEKNILILVEENKYNLIQFLSYNLMLNSGKKIRALRDPPFKLNGRSLKKISL